MTNVEKVLTVFRGITGGNAALATRYVNVDRFTEHDPHVRPGADGLARYAAEFDPEDRLTVVRCLSDGDYVVVQADGKIRRDGTFFDVFRLAAGLIVEHWGFAAPAGPPNKSGHTQVDGPTEPRPDVDTAHTKALVRDYYETVHLGGHHDQVRRFMAGDVQIRHEPGVADGVGMFERDLAMLTRDRTIDELVLFAGQGDLVFLAAKGTHQGQPCIYVDLYRVENEKLVEHWGFFEPEPGAEERVNSIPML